MPRYHVTLTDTEIQELKSLIQKGGTAGMYMERLLQKKK